MISTTTYDIVLVPFPLADSDSIKRRPCLVLASYKPRSLNEHTILAMMTSQIEAPNFPHDVILNDYKKEGLPKPTLVRLSKVVTLDSKYILKKVGSLTELDQKAVSLQFSNLFQGLVP